MLALPAFTIEQVTENADRAVIDALRAGSREAFSQIYAAEREGLYGFLVRLCRDRHLAAELFQNTWLKLARNGRLLREDTDVRAWLFTVARNEFRSHRRAQTLDLSRFLTLDRERASSFETAASSENGPMLDALEAALGKLGDADRELLLLVAVDGLELRQAAAVLGISYEALRQRLARAAAADRAHRRAQRSSGCDQVPQMSDAMKTHELDLLGELPKLAPPDDLVADVECLAFQELEASLGRRSVEKARRLQTVVIVPRYESTVHAMLVAAYTVCAAQAALRVLQRFIAG